MPATAFISYAHGDERYLERLHKHLAMLKRDGELEAWHDRQIKPGAVFEKDIKTALERSRIFIALVSPDFLASNYCYDVEFGRALELAAAGRLRIVPLIVEPCDWLNSPLSQFMALPKDGRAVSEWTNQNNAFLDVVNGLRRVLAEDSAPSVEAAMAGEKRKVKVRRDFDSIDKAEFADRSFATIRDYFKGACQEVERASDEVKARFIAISDNAFTCTVVNRAMRQTESHITVHNQKNRSFGGDISYSFQPYAEGNSAHGLINVTADEYNLYLTMDRWGFGSGGIDNKLTADQAAEKLWEEVIKKAGIEYD